MKWIYYPTAAVRQAATDTLAVYSLRGGIPGPSAWLNRWSALARSHVFLAAETNLKILEHDSRTVGVGEAWSRTLMLATVAGDIVAGYTALVGSGRVWA